MSADEEEKLWALMLWMLGGSACAAFAVAVPGDVACIFWVLAGVAAIMVAASVGFLLFNVHARASLKSPSKPASTSPSVAQSLRAAGVEDEWVREYVEKPLGVDAQRQPVISAPSSDDVEHLRQLAAMRRAAAARELRLKSQTVTYRPPRMHLHYRAPRERRDDQ